MGIRARGTLGLAMVATVHAGVACAAPVCTARARVTPEALVDARRLAGLAFTSARTLLVSGARGGIALADEIDLNDGTVTPRSTPPAVRATYGRLPDGAWLVGADQGGDEVNHLFSLAPSGRLTDLTPGADVIADFEGWSKDGGTFFVALNERDPRVFDLYAVDAASLERRLVFNGGDYRFNRPGANDAAAVSPGRDLVAVEKVVSNIKSDAILRNVASGGERNLSEGDGDVINRPLGFDPQGRALYLLSDRAGEFLDLERYDLKSGVSRIVVRGPGDVLYAHFSPDGRFALVGLNVRGATDLRLYDARSWRRLPLRTPARATISTVRFSPDSRRLAFIAEQTSTPGDVYLADVQSGASRRLASAWPTGFPVETLVQGEERRFRSFDGRTIAGVFYPPACRAVGPRRAAIWIHGGPNEQSTFDYNSMFQDLALAGYAVFEVNQRGSSGYGKTFQRLDDRRHGEDDLKDIVAAREMLVRDGFAGPDGVAVMGGSFGGFYTLSAITNYPDLFGAAVDFFGVTNWVRVLKAMPSWWTSRRASLIAEIGDPDLDRDYLSRISPANHLDRVRTPLLVIQGVNDPRVPKVESDDLVAAVRKTGTPVDFLLLEGEGHNWPVQRANELKVLKSARAFLDKHLH